MILSLTLLLSLWAFTKGDYECVCNYNVELEVTGHADGHGASLGYMYEFDCKPKIPGSEHAGMYEIMFEGKIGFVKSEGGNVQSQTCPGSITASDLVTTKTTREHTKTTTTTTPAVTTATSTTTTTPMPTTTSTTTPKPTTTTTTTTTPQPTTTTTPTPTTTTSTTTTTPQPTTTTTTTTTTTPTPTTTTTTTPKPTTTTTTTSTPQPTTTTTTTTTTTPTPTTTPTTTTTSTSPMPTTSTSTKTTPTTTPILTSSVPAHLPEGHIDLCPKNVQGDVNLFGGYLGQYGEYCLELVKVATQWHNAQRHCTVAGHGSLIDIQDRSKQDYIVRFLANHTDVQSIWLGLTDNEQEGASAEGQWTWISGSTNISGTPVSYTNFGSDYSGHTGATHKLNDCIIMKKGGEWTDVPCGVSLAFGTGFGERHNFICQYNLTSKPFNIFHELGTALVG